jgi:hypothetical protein
MNGGTGTSLVASSSTLTDFKTVSLTAGVNTSLSLVSDNIVISSSGALGTNTLTATLISSSTSLYYPTFISSSVSTIISAVNMDSAGLTYKPSDNTLTAGFMNSALFTSSNTEPTVGFMGLATSATKIQTTGIPMSASPYYITFVPTSISANSEVLSKDVGLTYTPDVNKISTSLFEGTTFTGTGLISSISFVGTATNATQIQTTGVPISASTYYITFVSTSSSANNEVLNKDLGLTYRPSDNSIGCGIVNAITFNSSTAASSAGFVGTSSQALQLATTLQTGSTSMYYPIFAPLASTLTNQAMSLDSAFTYTPSDNSIDCGIVNAITFNSSTAASSAGFVGTSSQALQLATTLQTVTASLYYPIFAPSASSSTNQAMSLDAGLYFQPSSNTLTALIFDGALTGTATLATNVVGVGTNNLLVQTGTNTTALLSNGTSGQYLKSNGTSLPTWANNSTAGLQMSFGGLGSVNGYLAPNRWADSTATALTSGVATKWRVPFNGSLTAISSSVTTMSASTTLAIMKNGATLALTIPSVAVSLTNYVVTTSTAFTTSDVIEIVIGIAPCGVCLFTLYFG